MIALDQYVTLYIPKARADTDRQAAKLLAEVCGGSTSTNAVGGYIRQDNGALEIEHVTLVTARFGDSDNVEAIFRAVAAIARNLLNDGEESVGIEYNGTLYLLFGNEITRFAARDGSYKYAIDDVFDALPEARNAR